jgi:xylulose-5-phosphate/fructose-6-phosphate phosphoketolase
VVGDGEAETGPLAASWHGNKFLNVRIDGAVLPVLQLNGYKIANPTVLARIPEAELVSLLEGYGWRPIVVSGNEPRPVHQAFAAALDEALDEIREIQRAAREDGVTARPRWPMLVLRTPKGWTGPQGGRWPAGRRHLALAPSADDGRPRQPRLGTGFGEHQRGRAVRPPSIGQKR